MSNETKGRVCEIGKFFIVSLEKKSGGIEQITVEASSETQAVSVAMDAAFARFPDEKLRLFLVSRLKTYTDGGTAR